MFGFVAKPGGSGLAGWLCEAENAAFPQKMLLINASAMLIQSFEGASNRAISRVIFATVRKSF